MNKFTITPFQNIWFSSDLHISHKNICKATSTWSEGGQRDFSSVEEMNEVIINNINNCVKANDIFFLLGDLTFGHPYNLYDLRSKIDCKNIYVILGNHDRDLRKNKAIKSETKGLIYPQSLFTEVVNHKEIYVDKQCIIMNHFAFRVWDQSHHGSWNLYGHSHGSLPPIGKQLDVGIDNAFNIFGEYRPFSFNEIKEIMDQKDVKIVDHHIIQKLIK